MTYKLIDYERLKAFSDSLKSKYATKNELPKKLSELQEDITHRLVTDAEKTAIKRSVSNVAQNYGENNSIVFTFTNNDGVTQSLSLPTATTRRSGLMSVANKRKLDNIQSEANKVTKLSELENDKTFKTELEIQQMISNASSLKKEVVTSLPQTGKDDVIYLVQDPKGKDNNNYLEYLWLNGKYELIGSTQVDLSGYAKKDEIKAKILQIDEYDTILTDNSFENHYLNTKIESKVGWRQEFFPRGVYFFRMENHEGGPEDRNNFIVMTSYNATVDIWNEAFQVHSRVVEQVAISLNTGKIYERYMDNAFDNVLNIEFGIPSSKGCSVYGIRGNWTNWQEITKDFATKDDITKAISTLTTFKKEIVASLPSTGQDNVFYLLKDTNGKDNNNYLEYLWIDNKWEMIGSAQVDLSGYATVESVNTLEKTYNKDIRTVSQYIDSEAKNVRAMLKKKEDTIQWGNGIYKDPDGQICAYQYNDGAIQDRILKLETYKLNNIDIQEFTQQELEEAFK